MYMYLNEYSKHALQVTATTLRFLGLVSLERIEAGTVNLQWNMDLCYVEEAMFRELLGDRDVTITRNLGKENCGKY